MLWECLPPLGAGTGQCSSPGLVWGTPSTGFSPEPDVQHRLCWAGHWAGACAQPSHVPDPGCANMLLAMCSTSPNGMAGLTQQENCLEGAFPARNSSSNTKHVQSCNLSLSEAPRAKVTDREIQGKSWTTSEALEFYFEIRTRIPKHNDGFPPPRNSAIPKVRTAVCLQQENKFPH